MKEYCSSGGERPQSGWGAFANLQQPVRLPPCDALRPHGEELDKMGDPNQVRDGIIATERSI